MGSKQEKLSSDKHYRVINYNDRELLLNILIHLKMNKNIKSKFIDYLYSLIQKHVDKSIQDQLLHKYLIFGDESRLYVSKTAVVNNALFNLASGNIFIGEHVFFGHNVCLLTGTHEYSKFNEERQISVPVSGRDIVIKEGAWIASNSTVIGPCIIGKHSVVGASSLVMKNVLDYTIVAGVPSKFVRNIPHD
jgi:acetyltransferase-like isoleucine patch superfamily enzyme